MNKLSTEKRALVLAALTEGNSVRATARLCGVSKLTVLRLLCDVGQLCHDYHDLMVRNLKTSRIEVDECWSFVGCKERNKQRGKTGHGDAWVWVALCAESKLVVSYLVGSRDAYAASEFMWDIADRVDERIQLTSDGHHAYLQAVHSAFGDDINYAMLVKLYGASAEAETRYSPSVCIGSRREVIRGTPDPDLISTSYVERQNLSLRTFNRRWTRLTCGFSRKLTNHEHAVALHYFAYNFIKRHRTLGTTPAVAAGIIDRELTCMDLARMLETEELLGSKGGRINRADRS